MDEYERMSAELAWGRSLAAARKAFAKDSDLELALEENVEGKFQVRFLKDALTAVLFHRHLLAMMMGIRA